MHPVATITEVLVIIIATMEEPAPLHTIIAAHTKWKIHPLKANVVKCALLGRLVVIVVFLEVTHVIKAPVVRVMAKFLLLLVLISCGDDNSDNPATCELDSCGHCPGDQTGIKICSFVATPTVSESITLINYTATDQDLTNWTLWDANALGNNNGEKSLSGTLTANKGTLVFGSLPFVINDSGETITLKNDSSVVVDSLGN